MEEIWKDIKGYEGLYQVSNLGNVKSLKTNKILKKIQGQYCNYGKRNEKMSKSKSKYKIVQKDKNNKIVKIWDCIWDLQHNTSYNKWVIRQCCKNKCKTAYGYKWEYMPIMLK